MALIYFGEEWDKNYNCSFYNYESRPIQQRLDIPLGSLYLVTFAFVWILYIPCVIAMCDRTLLKHSCYKLMLYLAILDLNTSIYVGFWAGFINVTGIHFCASRTVIFWIGCLNSVAWRAQSTATCLLAFNRCIDAYNKQWGKFLFHGYKTYFWMMLPILYGGTYMIIGCPGIFSPIYSSILYNPHAGYAEDHNNST
uniref:G-protein coupled receptors family 1 profile domain-containing protein n=1 Tax=Panagrolaimus davidi TaxID=227884 RepID=A0A914QSF3_9BILA